MNEKSFPGYLLPSCIILIIGCSLFWAATDGFQALTAESARRLHIAENQPAIPRFTLKDMNEGTLQLGQYPSHSDKITLVEFIYTTCPTICQAAGGSYARLRDRLVKAGLGNRVRLLSVSFDPERDGQLQMRNYANRHGADGSIWTIARAMKNELALLKSSFGVRVIPDNWGGYQHNAAIHLVDRSGHLSAIFDTEDVSGAYNALEKLL